MIPNAAIRHLLIHGAAAGTLAAALAGCGGGSSSDTATASASPTPNTSTPSVPTPSAPTPSASTPSTPTTDTPAPVSTPPATTPSTSASDCLPLAQRWRASTLTVAGSVSADDEDHPVVVAPRPDGTATLAWSDPNASTIGLATLSSTDQLAGSLTPLPGLQVHAGLADASGTTLAVVANDPDIYSPKYCWSAATPDKPVCAKLDLARVGTDGALKFRSTLTLKKNVDSSDAHFIWWYGHTARLATDGSNYGVYFRSAGSYPRPNVAGEVDIHAGDTLRFVSASGALLPNAGWDWGCSHSWSVRLAYDGHWGAACHGDAYPNGMQLAVLNTPTSTPAYSQWLTDTDATQRALGGLVPVSGGFWMNYVQVNAGVSVLHLARFDGSTGAITKDAVINAATAMDTAQYPFRVYMAAFGSGKLLLGWKSAGSLVLAVADAADGTLLEGPAKTTLGIDDFQELATTPAGDVLWAHATGSSKIAVSRVAACRLN